MSWVEIKKALNSTLGKKNFKSLDQIISKETYDIYYNYISTYVAAYGDNNGKIIIIPKTKTEISGEYYNNDTVTCFVIPNSVNVLGNGSFSGCHNLINAVIPDSITSIADNTFRNCTSLKNVILPESINHIGAGAFYGCSSMEGIIIPKTVTSISPTAFFNCNNLTDIYVGFGEGEIAEAPWGATNATVHYNYQGR